MKTVSCTGLRLESISLNKCNSLRKLEVYSHYDEDAPDASGSQQNDLTSLNLAACPNLKVLNCKGNKISALNLQKCKKLEELYCGDNCLTSLNLKNNKKLKKLDCSYNNLQKILVPSQKIQGDCRHNFLRRAPSLKMIKKFGKTHTIPQDKISKESVGTPWSRCSLDTEGGLIIWCDFDLYTHFSAIQIQIKKKGEKKWRTYGNGLKVTKVIPGLETGQTYEVRSRAKLKIEKKWYTGKWSETKAIFVE